MYFDPFSQILRRLLILTHGTRELKLRRFDSESKNYIGSSSRKNHPKLGALTNYLHLEKYFFRIFSSGMSLKILHYIPDEK